MLFRPTRIVRVTNKADLEAALLTADRVIVEGDDHLLSYAATRASQDPTTSAIDVETDRFAISEIQSSEPAILDDRRRDELAMLERQRSEIAALKRKSEEFPCAAERDEKLAKLAAEMSRPKKSVRTALLSSMAAVTIAALAGFWYATTPQIHPAEMASSAPDDKVEALQRLAREAESKSRGLEVARPGPAPNAALGMNVGTMAGPTPTTPENNSIPRQPLAPDSLGTKADSISQIVASLAWPTIAIVAIVALFMIARQAITAERDVEVSWKVTEKVSGRLVITKSRARARARNARAAA